jgi:hypothetical protein
MPIMAKVLLEAIFFNLHSPDDSENGDVGFYTRDTLRDRCGCLISLTSNGDKEYVSLAHYTVKEFLYSDRITHSTAAAFALSDTIVRTTFTKTLLEVVIRGRVNSDLSGRFGDPAIDSLEFFGILASSFIQFTEALWHAEMKEKDVLELRPKFNVLASSFPYLATRRRVICLEQRAVDDYNHAATLVGTRDEPAGAK